MKKIYIVITAFIVCTGSYAQTSDSLLRRQMELERDFNPTLLDADKINSLPALQQPVVQKANTNYSTWAGRTTPPLEIALPRPGNIMTEIPYSRKRGYLSFNAGNYANMDGIFGYRLVENEANNLTFSFLHNSTNGDIDYVQEVKPSSNKAKFMDNEGRLGYRHKADVLTLNMDLSYLHSLFNYYGNRFGNTPLYDDENQRLSILNAKIGVASNKSDVWNYRGYIHFNNFSTKFGESPAAEGIKGNDVNVMVGLDKPFGVSDSKLGVDGRLFSTFYNGDLSNYTLINAAPYVAFGGNNTYARLGADLLIMTSGDTEFRVAPHVQLKWAVTGHSSLYANILGGFSNNTFLEMIQESRYIHPYGNVTPSYSIIDIEAGARIGEVSGFRFDIFGGFKKTEDEHFLILNGQDVIGEDAPEVYSEVLKPVYGDLSHAHIGGMIQANIWAPLDISLRLKKNFYSADYISINGIEIDNPKAFNKPGIEVDLRGAVDLNANLKLTANYYFAGERWSYYGKNVKMDNINDLNAGAIYQINDAFSVNLRANNLLAQKYDIWYGYPAQGLNISGGFSFRF